MRIFESAIENSSNVINLSGFDSGIYMIQIVTEDKILNKKFTKK